MLFVLDPFAQDRFDQFHSAHAPMAGHNVEVINGVALDVAAQFNRVYVLFAHWSPRGEEMEQLDLFDDLVPVQRYLHVWNDAERARRLNKKPAPAPQWASTGTPPLKASDQERAEVMRTLG